MIRWYKETQMETTGSTPVLNEFISSRLTDTELEKVTARVQRSKGAIQDINTAIDAYIESLVLGMQAAPMGTEELNFKAGCIHAARRIKHCTMYGREADK